MVSQQANIIQIIYAIRMTQSQTLIFYFLNRNPISVNPLFIFSFEKKQHFFQLIYVLEWAEIVLFFLMFSPRNSINKRFVSDEHRSPSSPCTNCSPNVPRENVANGSVYRIDNWVCYMRIKTTNIRAEEMHPRALGFSGHRHSPLIKWFNLQRNWFA